MPGTNFRDSIANLKRAKKESYLSLNVVPERVEVAREGHVTYAGMVISDLFDTVERAEVRTLKPSDVDELENWYAASHYEVAQTETALLGVA